jgi:hypothetical protein
MHVFRQDNPRQDRKRTAFAFGVQAGAKMVDLVHQQRVAVAFEQVDGEEPGGA